MSPYIYLLFVFSSGLLEPSLAKRAKGVRDEHNEKAVSGVLPSLSLSIQKVNKSESIIGKQG